MANTPIVYVICDQNCKFEGMTKEQILTAIMQAVNEGTVGDIDAGFVTTIKAINGVPIKFFYGEQAAYDALTEAEKENLYAIITNDTTIKGINEAIKALQTNYKELKEGLQLGTFVVKNAENAARVSGPLVDLGGYTDSKGINVVLKANTTYIFFESDDGHISSIGQAGNTYILHVGDKNADKETKTFVYRSSASPMLDGTSNGQLFALEYTNTWHESSASYGTVYKVYCGGTVGTKPSVGNLKYIELAKGVTE